MCGNCRECERASPQCNVVGDDTIVYPPVTLTGMGTLKLVAIGRSFATLSV
jgi:hypothetical protein